MMKYVTVHLMEMMRKKRTKCRNVATATWLGLSTPVEKSSIMGKWYARIYEMKKYSKLFVGRQLTRFLDEENGKDEAIEMRCLKPKVGTGTILEDTPDPFPDIGMFKLYDKIARPLEVIPLKVKS